MSWAHKGTVIDFYFGADLISINLGIAFLPKLNLYLTFIQSLHMYTISKHPLQLGQPDLWPSVRRARCFIYFFFRFSLPEFSPNQSSEFWLYRQLYINRKKVDYSYDLMGNRDHLGVSILTWKDFTIVLFSQQVQCLQLMTSQDTTTQRSKETSYKQEIAPCHTISKALQDLINVSLTTKLFL